MSRAFVNEDAATELPLAPPRAPLPEGVPNYVTPRGAALLRDEQAALEAERARVAAHEPEGAGRQHRLAVLDQQIAALTARRRSARIVRTPPPPHDVVRFGACVTLRDAAGGTQQYRLVGVDEADAAEGRIAFTAPLARAVIGQRVGATVHFQAGSSEETRTIIAIEYEDEGAPGA